MSILWSHWLLLFWTLCVLPHGFQSQSGSLACTLSCLRAVILKITTGATPAFSTNRSVHCIKCIWHGWPGSSHVHQDLNHQLDIFLTTWHLFWHMGNGKCAQMGIMVNTEDTDGTPWEIRHMVDGAMGYMVNVVMCLIMCNFLSTAWIFTKILLDTDIDVFYLNIQWYSHDGLFKYKNS